MNSVLQVPKSQQIKRNNNKRIINYNETTWNETSKLSNNLCQG